MRFLISKLRNAQHQQTVVPDWNCIALSEPSWLNAFLFYSGRDLEFPYLSTLIGTISLGCLFLAVSFLLSLSTLLDGFALYHTIGYLHIITMINMNCALWYINCRAIGNASTGVAESFKKVFSPDSNKDEQN